MDFGFSGSMTKENNTSDSLAKQAGTQVVKTDYSKEAVDRMFYQGLQNGLAQIMSGDNAVGGFGSSAEMNISQDFLTNLMAEIATKTATQTTSTDNTQSTKTAETKKKRSGGGGLKTVICTRLKDLGYISLYIYTKGNRYAVPSITQHRGYMAWAPYVVPFLGAKNPRFTEFWKKLVLARYHYHIEPAHLRAHNIWSFLGVGILGNFSTLVGKMLNAKDAVKKHFSLTWEELKRG